MTIDLERRAFVQTGALLAAGTVLASATADPAAAQTSAQSAGAKPMSYAIKPLPFGLRGVVSVATSR